MLTGAGEGLCSRAHSCVLSSPLPFLSGCLVECLLIHFQERFTAAHLNTALSFSDLPSWPLGRSCFQLHSHQRKQSEVVLGLLPSSLGVVGLLLAARLVAGVGQSPPNAERHCRGLWVMAETVGVVRVSVRGALACAQEPCRSSCLPCGPGLSIQQALRKC